MLGGLVSRERWTKWVAFWIKIAYIDFFFVAINVLFTDSDMLCGLLMM